MFTPLTRERPRSMEIGCGGALAVSVAAPGFWVAYQAIARGDVRALAFAAFWFAAGLLFFLASVYYNWKSKPPETTVAIDPAELTPGQTIRIHIALPGPLRLSSMHMHLTGGGQTFPILDFHHHRQIAAGETLDHETTFTVPDIAPSVRWMIEVSGQAARPAEFKQRFPVAVVAQFSDA